VWYGIKEEFRICIRESYRRDKSGFTLCAKKRVSDPKSVSLDAVKKLDEDNNAFGCEIQLLQM
jgi:hypothetical protein